MAVDRSVALIGAGNMAEALLRGLLGTGTLAPHRCIVATSATTNGSGDSRRTGESGPPGTRPV